MIYQGRGTHNKSKLVETLRKNPNRKHKTLKRAKHDWGGGERISNDIAIFVNRIYS
jgi:hypothetical protein